MNSFQKLGAVLTDREKPLKVFFRNDDGGWADNQLQALCEDFASMQLPLDIAVIPDALSERSIELISGLINSNEGFAIHQHGFTHANHQLAGRSFEFGTDRDYQQQRDDIAAGQERLTAAFGSKISPIFTPPWNRCTSDTVAALQSLSIEYLSTIVGSHPIDGTEPERSIIEIPVAIDWLKKRKGIKLNKDELIDYVCGQFNPEDEVIGIMLHHEHMDRDNRALFSELIETLKGSQLVSFHSMLSLASPS